MASASPEPAHPSTWQLLFGKSKGQDSRQLDSGSNNDRQDPERSPINSHRTKRASPSAPSPQTPSPTIANHLLNALNAREQQARIGPEALIARECSDELLGKQNAFIPHMRNAGYGSAGGADPSSPTQRARTIIQTRFQVDSRADAIRRGKVREQQQRQATNPAARIDSKRGMTERLAKLREIQKQHDEREHQELEKRRGATKSKTAVRSMASHPTSPQPTTKGSSSSTRPGNRSVKQRDNTPLVSATVTKPKRAATAYANKATERNTAPKQTTNKTNNQEEEALSNPLRPAVTTHRPKKLTLPEKHEPAQPSREQRIVEDKLRYLQAENQELAALEERIQQQQFILRVQRRVWTIWRESVERRNRKQASVVHVYKWKQLQRAWGGWRNYARKLKTDRVEEKERLRKIYEKQMEESARTLYRRRQLPRWFYQWRSVATVSREEKQIAEEKRKRRDQVERLILRLAHKESPAIEQDRYEKQPLRHQQLHKVAQSTASPTEGSATKKTERKATSKKLAWEQNIEPAPNRTAAPCEKDTSPTLSKQSSASTSPEARTATLGGSAKKKVKTLHPPDPFYLSMQERAAQRKERREQLRSKYEQSELEKREALSKQVAERDAYLEQQKLEERERLREKKREEAQRARDKAMQLELAKAQVASSDLHNRLRLLFYHGFRPWHSQWASSKLRSRNAVKWHDLRTCHRFWLAWGEFIYGQRRLRHRQMQRQWDLAVAHHNRRVLSDSLAQWEVRRDQTTLLQRAVQRQTQWNDRKRWWRRWHQEYALILSAQQRKVKVARQRIELSRMSSILAHWKETAIHLKRDRVARMEREQLWKKARQWLDE